MKCQEKVTHEAILALTLYRLAHRTTREEEKKEKERSGTREKERRKRERRKKRKSAIQDESISRCRDKRTF